jgi:hypothetical protein
MKPSDLGIPLHRSRVFSLAENTLVWEARCNECSTRYLTDAGWYDAMGAARTHYRDDLKRALATLVRTGGIRIDDAREMLGLQPVLECPPLDR